jgi:hypothetical protein
MIDTTIANIAKLLNITREDSVNDFIGVNIAKHEDGTISLTQPKLIQSILDDLGLTDNTKGKIVTHLATTSG